MTTYNYHNFFSWCRLCISNTGVKINIYGSEAQRRNILPKIEKIIPITACDPYPKLICMDCVLKIESWSNYRETCITAQSVMTLHLQSLRSYYYENNKAAFIQSELASQEFNNRQQLAKKFLDELLSSPSQSTPDTTDPDDSGYIGVHEDDADIRDYDEVVLPGVGIQSEITSQTDIHDPTFLTIRHQLSSILQDQPRSKTYQHLPSSASNQLRLLQSLVESHQPPLEQLSGVDSYTPPNIPFGTIPSCFPVNGFIRLDKIPSSSSFLSPSLANSNYSRSHTPPANLGVPDLGLPERTLPDLGVNVLKGSDTSKTCNIVECRYCGFLFISMRELSSHFCKERQMVFTASVDTRPVTSSPSNTLLCELCGGKFKTHTTLERHIQKKCSVRPLFCCGICQQVLSTKYKLKQHMSWSHAQELAKSEYQCNNCVKRFKRECNYLTHLVSHEENRNYLCDMCGKYFTFKTQLESHIIKHIDDIENKQNQCFKCFKVYKDKNYFERHMKQCQGLVSQKPTSKFECAKSLTLQSCLNKQRGEYFSTGPLNNSEPFKKVEHNYCQSNSASNFARPIYMQSTKIQNLDIPQSVQDRKSQYVKKQISLLIKNNPTLEIKKQTSTGEQHPTFKFLYS